MHSTMQVNVSIWNEENKGEVQKKHVSSSDSLKIFKKIIGNMKEMLCHSKHMRPSPLKRQMYKLIEDMVLDLGSPRGIMME